MIPSKTDSTYEELMDLVGADLKDYPPTLQAKHISKYTGISLSVVYKLLKTAGFPPVELPGSKLILVPKSVFIKWYAAHLCKNQLDETRYDAL